MAIRPAPLVCVCALQMLNCDINVKAYYVDTEDEDGGDEDQPSQKTFSLWFHRPSSTHLFTLSQYLALTLSPLPEKKKKKKKKKQKKQTLLSLLSSH